VYDAIDHGKAALSCILPRNGDSGRKDLLELALHQLAPEHFADPQQGTVFLMMERFLENTGLVLPQSAVGDFFRNDLPGTALQYEEYYAALVAFQADPAMFGHHASQLRELAAQRMTGQALAGAMEILQRGAEQDKEWVQGHEAAREHALAKFAAVERSLRLQEAPEGDMRVEAMDIIADFNSRAEASRRGHGVIHTGITELDDALGGGIQRSELVLIAAASSIGKSTICADWAWRTVVEQGKNVVIFTSETNRIQFRFKIIARHSRSVTYPEWVQRFPNGLDTRDLRGGTLPREQYPYLQATVKNFADKPEHGRCYIAQVARGATMGTLEARLARISRMFPVDLVIIDYLMLLRSDRKRQSRREELSEIVIAAKEMATAYMDGQGVPVISPWQMNRDGIKTAAQQRGYYVTEDLSETAEAANTPDIILGLMPDGDDTSKGRKTPLKLGTVKVRDGVRLRSQIPLTVDYATSYIAPRVVSGAGHLSETFGGEAPI
jgi:replicative DNA helicase